MDSVFIRFIHCIHLWAINASPHKQILQCLNHTNIHSISPYQSSEIMPSVNLEYDSLCAFHGHSYAIDLTLYSSILWLTKNHSMNARKFTRISALEREKKNELNTHTNSPTNDSGEKREKHSVEFKQILRMNQLLMLKSSIKTRWGVKSRTTAKQIRIILPITLFRILWMHATLIDTQKATG